MCSVVPTTNKDSNLCRDELMYPVKPRHQIFRRASRSNNTVKATWNEVQFFLFFFLNVEITNLSVYCHMHSRKHVTL